MKRTYGVLVLSMMVVLSAACGGSEKKNGGGADRNKSLVIAADTSPTNLDVRVGADQGSGRIYDLAYGGLVQISTKGDYLPDIAEKWETPDDKTIIFHLRPNVKFQDGRPLTSKDVKWTFESMLAGTFVSPKKSGYSTVASFEAPDDKTFIIRLKEPNAGIFDNLTYMIVPQGADTSVFKNKPIGAGPYKVIDFRADDRVELEAFNEYYGGPPNIKNVVVRIIPDATTRVLELRKGSVNFAINAVPYDSVPDFEKNPDFRVVKEPGAVYQYLAFNLRDPILKRREVREAMAMSIDRDRIVKDLLRGYGTVTETMFPQGHWARADNLPTHPYNPAQAMALLDKTGLRDPDGKGPKTRFSIRYSTSTDAEANQQAEMIQQMLKEVGIGVQIQSNEFGTFYEDIQKGNFQMFSLRRAGVSDPDFYYTIFHSKSIPPEGQNRGFYVNPKVDRLIEEGRSTFDRAKRHAAYVEIQKMLAEDLPYLSLYNRFNVAIMRKNISGFEMYPSGFWLSVPRMKME